MSINAEPNFVAAEMAYRYERDHVTSIPRHRAQRHPLSSIWHRMTDRRTTSRTRGEITSRA